MDVNLIYPSKFLKAHDLAGKSYTLTIREATLETLGYGNEKEQKLALAFVEARKMMLLNRTNAMVIASMYGPETTAWHGKQVVVYSARVKAFGAWHDALRVKEQVPARNTGAPKLPDAMVEAPPIDDEEDVLDVDEGNPLVADFEEDAQPRTIDAATGEILPAGNYFVNAPNTENPDNIAPNGLPTIDGDVLFAPDIPLRATVDQLDKLDLLGAAFYGADEWPAKLDKMVEAATTGATSIAAQLKPAECAQLIRVIEKRLAAVVQSTNGAKVTA